MSGGRWRCVAALTAGILAVGLSSCSGAPAPETAAPGITPKLIAAVPEHLSVGVVVSVTSAPGEGAEWREAAEGARVAADRFALGGSSVELVPMNDKGTVDGAAAAVKTLGDQGVAGIVLATSGHHIRGALAEAATRQLPVLVPYAETADGLPPDAWLTGPGSVIADERLAQALDDRGLTRPDLIDAGGGSVGGVEPVATQTFDTGDDPADLARTLAARQLHPTTACDAVVISGPAALQGRLVSELQGAGVDLPIMLTPDALSPTFPRGIVGTGGSLSGTFVSAGLDEGDSRALEPSESGRALAAYFTALNLSAGNPEATDLFAERPFHAVAGTADVRSHDAVVALVRAAAAARSAEPAEVGKALSGMHLTVADGLAGPPLDFSAPVAVADGDVRALAATSVSPGVRPPGGGGSTPGPGSSAAPDSSHDAATLFWYSATAG